jgi:hypothetical protein
VFGLVGTSHGAAVDRGGRACGREAGRKGFGTTLIELELKQISGNAKFGDKDSGFEATLSIPFDPKLMSLGPEPGRPD